MHPLRDSIGTFTLFVYGTLRRGGCRHGPLAWQRFLGEVLTTPAYHLFDLGDYPGLVRADHDGQVVHGELYEVECALIAWLDTVEGAPGWFDLGPIAIAGRSTPAWAYYYQQDPRDRPRIETGRWEPPENAP